MGPSRRLAWRPVLRPSCTRCGAIIIEAVFGAACALWFLRAERDAGRQLPPRRGLILYAIFVLGALIWLPTATVPLGSFLGH